MTAVSFEFTPVARLEVMAASRWYAAKNSELALRFNRHVTEELQKICRNPQRYAEVRPGIRRAHLPDFPYNLYYWLDSDILFVIAILHTRRDPSIWQNRS
ncbi:type II toxin-antitoxin system RelE/ParE family toxin [Asticcacaulis sp. BYS171W]|uniref:Type II toxin-antitoxin system RelE/ParE family toxin n=1 Tax=Asticcacaulis aquaticus TaxID=2984212 RepID=A0ABT5HPD1_9CAUL|nr:type II toxin-antitoxin system RelE/ParE family toxin [Asticcacaulis aquaticus]